MDDSFDYHKRSAQLERVDSLIDRVVMGELNRLADQLGVDRSLVAADYTSNWDGPEDVHTNGKALRSELRKNHEAATEAAGVLLIALVALGFAPMRLTSRTLWLPALATGGIVGAAIGLAIAGGRRLRLLLATLSPPVVVVGFATFYGNRMLSNPPGLVSTNVAGPLRLIEPILLSVGIGTTGGFLDLAPKSAMVRWGALAEMLILVSLVGGTVYSVVAAGLRELRAERRQED